MLRIDHQITSKQRIFGRYMQIENPTVGVGYLPSIPNDSQQLSWNVGLNYDYSVTPSTLLNVSLQYYRTHYAETSPGQTGIENLTTEAGIQGFPTAIETKWIGLPSVAFTGYSGFMDPWGVPFYTWALGRTGRAGLTLIRGKHTMKLGYEYDDRPARSSHASCCGRGSFSFNGQYTGNGFADYLLGLVQTADRTTPIENDGMYHTQYQGSYFQDDFTVSRTVTLNLGVRWDHWNGDDPVCGQVSTWDIQKGVAVAGLDSQGQVNLNCNPISPYLAAYWAGLWVPASQVGYPKGLVDPSSYVSPRVGVAWRATNGLVVRGAYGIFAHRGYTTNYAGVGPSWYTLLGLRKCVVLRPVHAEMGECLLE